MIDTEKWYVVSCLLWYFVNSFCLACCSYILFHFQTAQSDIVLFFFQWWLWFWHDSDCIGIIPCPFQRMTLHLLSSMHAMIWLWILTFIGTVFINVFYHPYSAWMTFFWSLSDFSFQVIIEVCFQLVISFSFPSVLFCFNLKSDYLIVFAGCLAILLCK